MIVVVITVVIAVVVAHQVMHTDVVSAAEAFTIGFAFFAGKMRMTELIAVVHIEPAVIIEVFPGAFDAIAKTLVLDFRQICRGHIPPAALLGETGNWLGEKGLDEGRGRC